MSAIDFLKAHPLEVVTGLALVVGTMGNVLADAVDPIAHPRLFQFGKFCQNVGIAIPKALERLALLLKGSAAGSPDKPPPSGPPAGGGVAPLLGVAFLVGALTLPSACGTGAKACAVVDIAHESCRVVRYLAPDGSSETLDAHDLATIAAAKRAARARPTGATDGSAPPAASSR